MSGNDAMNKRKMNTQKSYQTNRQESKRNKSGKDELVSMILERLKKDAHFEVEEDPSLRKHIAGQIKSFSETDPLNGHLLSGFIYSKGGHVASEAALHGTLLITSINDYVLEEPQIVYGKAEYSPPYATYSSNDFEDFDVTRKPVSVFLTPYKSGQHVTFFKYFFQGRCLIGVKSNAARGVFVQNVERQRIQLLTRIQNYFRIGRYSELTSEEPWQAFTKSLPQLALLASPHIQSVSCEMGGSDLNSLTCFVGELAFRPVYMTMFGGDIRPVLNKDAKDVGPEPYQKQWLLDQCGQMQIEDEKANVEFRKHYPRGKLENVWEYNHYATEGRLLFLLDAQGNCINRDIVVIEPADLTEAASQVFDQSLEARIRAVCASLGKRLLSHHRPGEVDEKMLKRELGMGWKQWGMFGKAISQLAKLLISNPTVNIQKNDDNHTGPMSLDGPRMLITVGVPGSGKSTLAEAILKKSQGKWHRINQDKLGSRKACESLARKMLSKGENVLIDRTNVDIWQRNVWIQLAREYNVSHIECLFLDIPIATCKDRIMLRANHPTLPPNRSSVAIVDTFKNSFIPPVPEEGFDAIRIARTIEEVDQAIDAYASIVQ